MISTSLQIKVPYGQQCSYLVETACGWPQIKIDETKLDIAALLVDMSEEPKDVRFPTASYPFNENETFISNSLLYGSCG